MHGQCRNETELKQDPQPKRGPKQISQPNHVVREQGKLQWVAVMESYRRLPTTMHEARSDSTSLSIALQKVVDPLAKLSTHAESWQSSPLLMPMGNAHFISCGNMYMHIIHSLVDKVTHTHTGTFTHCKAARGGYGMQ